ncbi:hypothetical protein F4803DRAFT_290030 [Xylaria telfairii]|nr:hypothetical protein F4803DRAFT_290030 [Xylaria telfairii]
MLGTSPFAQTIQACEFSGKCLIPSLTRQHSPGWRPLPGNQGLNSCPRGVFSPLVHCGSGVGSGSVYPGSASTPDTQCQCCPDMLYASVERGVDLVAIRYPETNRDTANGQYGLLFHPSHPEGGVLVGRCKDRPHVQHDQRCAVSYSFNFCRTQPPLRHWRKPFLVLGPFPSASSPTSHGMLVTPGYHRAIVSKEGYNCCRDKRIYYTMRMHRGVR